MKRYVGRMACRYQDHSLVAADAPGADTPPWHQEMINVELTFISAPHLAEEKWRKFRELWVAECVEDADDCAIAFFLAPDRQLTYAFGSRTVRFMGPEMLPPEVANVCEHVQATREIDDGVYEYVSHIYTSFLLRLHSAAAAMPATERPT